MFTRNWLTLLAREIVALVCTITAGILRCFEVLYLDWFISRGEIRKNSSGRIISSIRMLLAISVSELAIYKIAVIFSGNFIAIGCFCLATLALLLFSLYNMLVVIVLISRLVSRKAISFFYCQIYGFWISTKSYLYNGCEKDRDFIEMKNRYLKLYSPSYWTSADMLKDKRYKILKFDDEVKQLLKKKIRAERRCA